RPDPLPPPAVNGAPLLAPGAGAAEALPDSAPVSEADAIVLAVRARLATMPVPREAGERDDLAAIKAFYAARAQPVWVAKAEFSARARQAILEIGQADDWGLKAAAFDLPKPLAPGANTEALAESEIKLAFAVLTYARQARGGRLEPAVVSRKFDQKPPLYEPQSLLLATASVDDIAGYLRGLHPKHEQ